MHGFMRRFMELFGPGVSMVQSSKSARTTLRFTARAAVVRGDEVAVKRAVLARDASIQWMA